MITHKPTPGCTHSEALNFTGLKLSNYVSLGPSYVIKNKILANSLEVLNIETTVKLTQPNEKFEIALKFILKPAKVLGFTIYEYQFEFAFEGFKIFKYELVSNNYLLRFASIKCDIKNPLVILNRLSNCFNIRSVTITLNRIVKV